MRKILSKARAALVVMKTIIAKICKNFPERADGCGSLHGIQSQKF